MKRGNVPYRHERRKRWPVVPEWEYTACIPRGMHVLNVRCEFRVAKASINVPSPGAYPISDIRYPRLRLRTLTLSRSDAHERGLARQRCCASFVHGYTTQNAVSRKRPQTRCLTRQRWPSRGYNPVRPIFWIRGSESEDLYLKGCE